MIELSTRDVLLVIDYQNDFVASDGRVAKVLGADVVEPLQAIAPAVQEALEAFRRADARVVFLMSDYSLDHFEEPYRSHRARGPYGDAAKTGTWGHELYGVKRHDRERIVVKHFVDGFLKSDLEDTLEELEIERLYVCGVNTDACVLYTGLGAAFRGFETYIIADATATFDEREKERALTTLQKLGGVARVSCPDFS